MKPPLKKFYAFLDQPLFFSSRVLLALLVVPLLLTFTGPLWHIHLKAPQYPAGLDLYIWAYKIEGGNDGHDVTEINLLNHYIGMRALDQDTVPDLDWLPFVFGGLALFVLRVAAIGNVRALIDLCVVTGYLMAFSFGRFVYQMYIYGHELDPRAPITIKGFWPPIFGTKQIANFTSTSLPAAGSYYVGVATAGIIGLTLWHLIWGYRDAHRAPATD